MRKLVLMLNMSILISLTSLPSDRSTDTIGYLDELQLQTSWHPVYRYIDYLINNSRLEIRFGKSAFISAEIKASE